MPDEIGSTSTRSAAALRRPADEDRGLDLGGPALASGRQGIDVSDHDGHVRKARSSSSTPPTPTSSARRPEPSIRYSNEKGTSAGSIASAAAASRQTSSALFASAVLRAEISQGAQAAFAEHAPGLLVDDAEDAADAAVLDADRIVRDVVVRLFEEPLPVEKEGVLLRPERLTRPDHALEERSEDVPHLAPALARGTTERPRMLRAEHRRIGIVVDRDELGTPEEDDLRLRRQQDADRAPEALRPRLHRTERRCRPVVRADALAHLPAACQVGFRDDDRRACAGRVWRFVSPRLRTLLYSRSTLQGDHVLLERLIGPQELRVAHRRMIHQTPPGVCQPARLGHDVWPRRQQACCRALGRQYA